ncbi:hypothetical protein ACFX13_003387 [Malus domestica]
MSSFSLHPSPSTSLYVNRDSTVGSISRLLWPRHTGSGFVDCLNIGGREGNFLKDWVKGSALSATADLEKSLHNEYKRLFLTSFESYLNEVLVSKSSSMELDSHVAEMMCQIKKVGDWLEPCGRVKKRFMGVFLKHVERTCMVLDHMNVVIGDRQL